LSVRVEYPDQLAAIRAGLEAVLAKGNHPPRHGAGGGEVTSRGREVIPEYFETRANNGAWLYTANNGSDGIVLRRRSGCSS
jgi:hypothetical protein